MLTPCGSITKLLEIRVWRSLVSRLNGVQEAAGSSPVTRTTGKRKVLCYKLRNTAQRSNNNCTGISGKTLIQERFHYGNHAASRRNIRTLTVDLIGKNIEIQIAHILDRIVVGTCE